MLTHKRVITLVVCGVVTYAVIYGYLFSSYSPPASSTSEATVLEAVAANNAHKPHQKPKRSTAFCSSVLGGYELCEYEFLCTNGKQIFLVDDQVTERSAFTALRDSRKKARVPLPEEARVQGWYIPPSKIRPSSLSPFASINETNNLSPSASAPSENSDIYTVSWLEGNTWVIFPETQDTENIAHWLQSYMPIYEIMYHNETLLKALKTAVVDPQQDPSHTLSLFNKRFFPSIDNIISPQDWANHRSRWQTGMIDLMIPEQTHIYWAEDILLFDPSAIQETERKLKEPARAETTRRPPSPLRIENNNHLVCAEKGFIPGFNPIFFSGIEESRAFRKKVYSSLNLPLTRDVHPLHVLITDRGNRGRSFLEPKFIINIVHDVMGLNYTYVEQPGHLPFADQVKLYYGAGISIQPHGAGWANMMFQLPGTAAIEVFPYLHHYRFFSKLAAVSEVYYYAHNSMVKDKSIRYRDEKVEEECKKDTVRFMLHAECIHPSLGGKTTTSAIILEYLIISAFRAVGHFLTPSPQLSAVLSSTTLLSRPGTEWA